LAGFQANVWSDYRGCDAIDRCVAKDAVITCGAKSEEINKVDIWSGNAGMDCGITPRHYSRWPLSWL
jgi:hypothetical protein